MTTKIPQERDFASRLREKMRDDELLHKYGRTSDEEREVTKILRAQGLIPRRIRGIRSLIRRTVRRARARRTAPATAARASDSGGSSSGDPDPEPPRPQFKAAVLAVMGGAI